jgi:hypothetical protein
MGVGFAEVKIAHSPVKRFRNGLSRMVQMIEGDIRMSISGQSIL